nr:MAG TPA: hypothetical protein [Caudoviricetes sp.]
MFLHGTHAQTVQAAAAFGRPRTEIRISITAQHVAHEIVSTRDCNTQFTKGRFPHVAALRGFDVQHIIACSVIYRRTDGVNSALTCAKGPVVFEKPKFCHCHTSFLRGSFMYLPSTLAILAPIWCFVKGAN